MSSFGCWGRVARAGDLGALGSRPAWEGSILGDGSVRGCETGSGSRSGTASGRLGSEIESLPRPGPLFFDRKISLIRPAGEVDRRETVRAGRSEDDWRREARDSESTEPERSLECADVLEAPSADDVSGTYWDCRWRSAWETDDRGEAVVLDLFSRGEGLS